MLVILRETKHKKVMEHYQTVESPEKASQSGGQLFGVHLPFFDSKF